MKKTMIEEAITAEAKDHLPRYVFYVEGYWQVSRRFPQERDFKFYYLIKDGQVITLER